MHLLAHLIDKHVNVHACGLGAWTYAINALPLMVTCNPLPTQVQKTAAALAGNGFAAPRTMECLLREYEACAACGRP